MNNISDEKIIQLLKDKKDPIKSFIESNKYLADKSYIGKTKEIDWVIDKKVVEYIPTLIDRINKIKNEF